MRIFSFAYGLFWTIVGLGVLFFAERNDNNWLFLVLVVFLLGLGLGTVYGSLRLKLEVAEGELRYHGFLSSYRVPLTEITQVTIERYNGGIFFPLTRRLVCRSSTCMGILTPRFSMAWWEKKNMCSRCLTT